ncbi:30S ribosomal protein S8 [Candidatus Woesearchaeota archaeon]|nr:30S ribosomal protein S8 [Candidatus Woesearchaeota archaeon]
MLNDPLANALSNILNHEKIGRDAVLINPLSGVVAKVLDILNQEGYVGKYEIVSEGKGKLIKLHLLGHINKCGVIKPRFGVKKGEFERFEKRFLPARNIGIMLISTPKGIMTHSEAKKKGQGGKLICYCY